MLTPPETLLFVPVTCCASGVGNVYVSIENPSFQFTIRRWPSVRQELVFPVDRKSDGRDLLSSSFPPAIRCTQYLNALLHPGQSRRQTEFSTVPASDEDGG